MPDNVSFMVAGYAVAAALYLGYSVVLLARGRKTRKNVEK